MLKHITNEQVALAKQMINDHKIEVSISDTEHILYSEATLFNTDQQVKVRIAAHHTNVIYIEKNGELLFSKPCVVESENAENVFANLNAKDIYDFSLNVELEKIRFIQQAAILIVRFHKKG
ncbi:Uncharacterised protein [Actinobacillus pleuropneumoniae]|nr:Uncharacterised protein [Actinobacillus pleuropneumoniae]